MKWILRKLAPRMSNTPSRLLLGCVYGMLELYGLKQTSKDAIEVISQVWRLKWQKPKSATIAKRK